MSDIGSTPSSGSPPEQAATIYDVAKRAGVSITTVSNALNRSSRVNVVTLERVLSAIDELHFTPKADAVSLARKGVGRIGVIAPFNTYASFWTRLEGVLRACEGQGVEVVIFDQESAAEAATPLFDTLPTTGRLDGLLIMGLPLKSVMARRLVQRKLPAVLVDSYHEDLSSVNVDDEEGGRRVGAYFASKGYRSFAYVTEPQRSSDFLSQGQKRIIGFRKAIADVGIDPEALRLVFTTHNLAGGMNAAIELARGGDLPQAIFAHFDDIAAGLLSGFRSLNVRVPEDVAVIGYDDGVLAEALGISTVRQPFAEAGETASFLLLDKLHGKSRSGQHLSLSTELVIRETA